MAKTTLSQSDLDFMAYALSQTPEETLVEETSEISPEEQQFIRETKKAPKPPKMVSRGRSLAGAIPKGFYKVAGRALGAMPSGGKTFEETIEEIFPTQEGRFLEGALERGSQLAAGGGATGAGGLLRSLLGGVLGESVSKAPFIPENVKPFVEAGAEISAFGIPGFGKKIIPTEAQRPLVEGARELGFTEKEITPLVQSEKKVGILGKEAGKRFRTQKALKGSKNVLDQSLEALEAHPDIERVLVPQQAEPVISNIEKKMFDKLNTQERKYIKEDFEILKNSAKSAKDFVKFFRDINKAISKNPDARRSLNLIKDDVIGAVQKISPKLGNTFNLTNKLYSNYSKIAQKLKPSWQQDISKWAARGIGHAIIGPLLGSVPSLTVIGSEIAAANLAREMLINPRFQNLSRQMVQALNSNKIGVASRIWDKFSQAVGKVSPEIASEMEKVDWELISKEPENQKD